MVQWLERLNNREHLAQTSDTEDVLGVQMCTHVRILFHHSKANSTIITPGTMGGNQKKLQRNYEWLTFQGVLRRYALSCLRGG